MTCPDHAIWVHNCAPCYLARVPSRVTDPYPALRSSQLRHAIAEAEDCAIRCARDARYCAQLAASYRDRDPARASALERAALHADASAAAWTRDADQLRQELDRLPRA